MQIVFKNYTDHEVDLTPYADCFRQVVEQYRTFVYNRRLLEGLLDELEVHISVSLGNGVMEGHAAPMGFMLGEPPILMLELTEGCLGGSMRSFAFTAAHELTHIWLGGGDDLLLLHDSPIWNGLEEACCDLIGARVIRDMELSDADGRHAADWADRADRAAVAEALMGSLEDVDKVDDIVANEDETFALPAGRFWYALVNRHAEWIGQLWDERMGQGAFEDFCGRLGTMLHIENKAQLREELLWEVTKFFAREESKPIERPRSDCFRVALMQLDTANDIDRNIQKAVMDCRMAALDDVDVILFPEMWTCGYTIPEDPEQLKKLAIPVEGAFSDTFGALAKELDTAIAITLLEAHDPLPRNTLCLFDRHGELIMTYAKVHTCDFGDECRLTPGDDFYVTELDTRHGPVQVGAMICYDREFPESARILMLKGAEVILVPNACPMEINRLAQLRGRAYENMVGIATCNYPAGHPDCNGHSSAFDGIAYRPEVSGSCDTCLFEASGEADIYVVDFPIREMRDYRSREVHGNAYRRPECYGLLLDEQIRPPFVRSDRRR